MNIKQKLIALLIVLSSFIAVVSFDATAYAACTPGPGESCCGGTETSIIACPQNSEGTDTKNNGIWGVLLIALNILTASVGIAAVGGIVYGSILYTTAADSTEQTKKAIEVIRNVVIGLVAYGMMYIGLNFLIPGGVFT